MRLVNVETLRLEDFLEDDAPPYAILSHTWGEDSEELSFHDFNRGSNGLADLKPSRGLGLAKFHGSCRQAKKDNIGHVWIDTCCIDRTNSVELSEAINSMFRWYSQAHVCYAYLADVPSSSSSQPSDPRFRSSRWFERGWTLQELLAPERMKFYDVGWDLLGTKGGLSASIAMITGIPRRYLLGLTALRDASVAQRMSWAAQRRTKRPEDVAYCLLGIFDVSMPMVYGEGRRHAFFRLQEQIIRKNRDDSILAWGLVPSASEDPADSETLPAVGHGNVLADHPSDFVNCGSIAKGRQQSGLTYALEISGDGIRANLALDERPSGDVSAVLCCYPESDTQLAVSVPLVPTAENAPGILPDEFIRPQGRHATFASKPSSLLPPRSIYIRNEESPKSTTQDGQQPYWFLVEGDDSAFDGIEVEPNSSWHVDRSLFSMTVLENGASILIRFCSRESATPDLVVKVMLATEGSILQPRCFAMRSSREFALATIADSLRAIPRNRMQPQVLIGNRLYNANIISAGEATLQNLFILDLQVARSLTSASSRHLDMDEELRKCLARVRSNRLESGEQIRKPPRRRFVKIPCPGRQCDATVPREWLCSTCHTYLEHGFTDDYFYCDCGRSHYRNFDFKCASSMHGPDFQSHAPNVLDRLPKSLDSSSYINILILGERGVGKSTLINAFVNYLAHSTFDEAVAANSLDWAIPTSFSTNRLQEDGPGRRSIPHRVVVGSEGEDERWDHRNRRTHRTLVHVFPIGNRVLRFIDTPGIREEDNNKEVMTDILRTLINYDSLHGILVVVKSITFRLASSSSYSLKEILSHLHQSATPNILFGFTNGRSTKYSAQAGNSFGRIEKLLAESKTARLSLGHDTTYCFDSESFICLAALKNGVSLRDVEDYRRSWDHSRGEMWRLIDYCAARQPHNPANMVSPCAIQRQSHRLLIKAAGRAYLWKAAQEIHRKERQKEQDRVPLTTLRQMTKANAREEKELKRQYVDVLDAIAGFGDFLWRNAIVPFDNDAIENLVLPHHWASKIRPNAIAQELASKMEELATFNPKPLQEADIAPLLKQMHRFGWLGADLPKHWDPLAIADGGVYRERPHKVHNGSGYVLTPGGVRSTAGT